MHSRGRYRARVLSLAALLSAPELFARADTPPGFTRPAGRALALPCLACHGSAHAGAIPEIRGVEAERLVARMREYRDVLKQSVMHRIARGYSDEDYTRLAEYFKNLRKDPR